MSNAIIDQLRLRDTLLKRSKHSNNPDEWDEYKKARNKAVGMLKSAKRKYYLSKLENNKNNAKEMWKTIKSISGLSKQSKRVNNLKVGRCLLENNQKIASELNARFTSIADQLRSLLPQLNLTYLNFKTLSSQERVLASLSPFLLLQRARSSIVSRTLAQTRPVVLIISVRKC